MENKKYTKGTIIRKYKLATSGHWTNYQPALDFDESELLKYAEFNKYVVSANDAPRGGKWGEHYLVLKYFTTNSLTRKMQAEIKARNAALAEVVKTDVLETFRIYSDVGSFKIDGVYYSNFCGNGTNSAVICTVDFAEFQKAKKISQRQIFNTKSPITIVKFDEPKTINVSLSDVDESAGMKTIDNVCGFAIWEHKLKIFTVK